MLRVSMQNHFAACHFVQFTMPIVIILSVIMLCAVMLFVTMLSVIMATILMVTALIAIISTDVRLSVTASFN